MNVKSVIALLLLANYMLLAGVGCIKHPEQDSFSVLIMEKLDGSQHYESRRYLRMDGLEAFMVESLASRYNENTDASNSEIHYLVSGIDVHYLPTSAPFSIAFLPQKEPVSMNGEPGVVLSVASAIYSPPEAA